jgi:hypothetical protein
MTLAQGTVVVEPGEGYVFEGEMAQPVDCGARSHAAGGDLGEESFELLGSHAT